MSNSDNASVSLRKHLLETCNLHTVLDMPAGTFTGAGVKTVVLFFTKGTPTTDIWYYQCMPGRSMGKTTPLNDTDLEEFINLQKTKADSEKSWSINISRGESHSPLHTSNYELTVKNPKGKEEQVFRSIEEILAEMETLDEDTNSILQSIKERI